MPVLCGLIVKVFLEGQRSNTKQFHVLSINPVNHVPLEGFSSNLAHTSTRKCAESMPPLCSIKVTFTNRGQMSYTSKRIFFKLGS
jgi:hypothetical protein